MRTKTLSANQRVRIGTITPPFGADKMNDFAAVLKRVGLTLEVEAEGSNLVLYACRRISTEDVKVLNVAAKPAREGAA